jgi:outer membrane immunogenic protein
MRTLLLAGVALAGLITGPAIAADVDPVPYVRQAVRSAPWSGFYLGIAGGYGWADSEHDFTSLGLGTSGTFRQTGWIVGGTFGYNWQIGTFLVGVEGDLSAADLVGSTAAGGCAPPQAACETKLSWFHTARARVGVAWGPVMPYLTGGLAAGGVKVRLLNLSPANPHYLWGGVVGGGVEWMFAPGWSAKGEYLFVPRFSTASDSDMTSATVSERNVGIFRIGLNYNLGSN